MIIILISKDSWCEPVATALYWKFHDTQKISVAILNKKEELEEHEDIEVLLLLGYYEKLEKKYRDMADIVCCFHESALPTGRGWAPLTWQILEGKQEITVTLFEVIEAFDAGDIYLQDTLSIPDTAVISEIRQELGSIYIRMFITAYIDGFRAKNKQKGIASYYPRRTPLDSELDQNKTISEQFDLLRVCDHKRYPAFFMHKGKKYLLKLESGD